MCGPKHLCILDRHTSILRLMWGNLDKSIFKFFLSFGGYEDLCDSL